MRRPLVPTGGLFVSPTRTATKDEHGDRAGHVPRLRHDAARRRPAGGAQPLGRRQARDRAPPRRPRRRLHRGRLAGRQPQGHRVLRPGPPRARPAARAAGRVRRDPPGRREGRRRPAGGRAARQRRRAWSRWSRSRHDRHVELALRTTLEENLAMVRDTVAHLRAEGRRVFLDAEHFFDGYRDNRDYALEVLRTAAEAGADVVVLCDTNGGMLPAEVADVVARRAREHRRPARHPLPQRHRLRGRQHARRGRRRRHPRAGHRSTATASAPATPTWSPWWPTSSSSWTGRCCRRALLREVTRIAHAVAEVTNVTPDLAPAVRRGLGLRAQGRPARLGDQGRPEPLPAHRPGAGRQRHAACWSPTWPAAPRSSSRAASSASTWATTGTLVTRVTERVKELESRGYTFEAADASFELLLREEVEGARPTYFTVESWRVIVERRARARRRVTEATVKLRAGASGSSPPARATARSTPSTTRCAWRSGRPTRSSRSSS